MAAPPGSPCPTAANARGGRSEREGAHGQRPGGCANTKRAVPGPGGERRDPMA